jgi:hypothetical protein
MTVRTWITISVAVLVALSVAVVVQFLRPVPAPAIVVHAGDVRLDGAMDGSCWPQRNGELRCVDPEPRPDGQTIDGNGSFRIVFAYPGEPKTGEIAIDEAGGEPVLSSGWKRTLRYELEPGSYTLTARAGDEDEAFVRYAFAFNVTRSGS